MRHRWPGLCPASFSHNNVTVAAVCRSLVAMLGFALAAHAGAQSSAAPVPGMRLPRDVVPLLYEPKLRIDPAVETFTGSVDITMRVLEPTDLVWLNAKRLDIRAVRAVALATPGEEISGAVVPGSEEVIGLRFARILPAGEVKVTIAYSGTFENVSAIGLFRQQEGDRWYALTQFEPMDARRAFPCFDEPDRKAAWHVTLVVPEGLRAFSNMPVEKEQAADKGWREVTFQRTPLLPSYLVAFAVGDFDVRDAGRAGMANTPISIITPKGRAGEAAYAAANTGAILAAAERFFGAPYPFPKLDLLAYPMSTFGGAMENPGLITYTARILLARADEISPTFEQRFVGVTAHEIAHMWFGDYVTMAWWNDLWLNESFASWLGSRLVLELRPQWPSAWRALQRTKAIELDRLSAARKLRQPVTEYSEVRAAFDSITYAKGETLLAMFEQWLGEDKFREGVRRYVTKYAWGNATADDFFASLAASDDAVIPAFRGFADRSGVPLLDVSLDCSGKPSLVLTQQRFVPAGGAAAGDDKWVFPACFDFGDATKGRQACTLVRDAKQTMPLPVTSCPQWVVANRSGIGYYLPRLSPSLYAALPKADRVLGAGDYDSMLGDLDVLARGGAVGYQVSLQTVARLAASPDARVTRRAYAMVDKVPAAIVDSSNAPRYAAWVRHHFGDRARALGLIPQKGEAPDVTRLRSIAVPTVAVRGQDTALARKAQQLAARWLTHRSAIPPEGRSMILTVAARTSDKDAGRLFDALLVIASASSDANERADVYEALGAFRDPALLARALPLTLASSTRSRFSLELLESALSDDVTRAPALVWIAANIEPLSAALPREQHGFLPTFAGDACSVRERALFVAAFEANSAKVDAGARRYRQTLEGIDSCIAMRRAHQAAFNAFLATAQ